MEDKKGGRKITARGAQVRELQGYTGVGGQLCTWGIWTTTVHACSPACIPLSTLQLLQRQPPPHISPLASPWQAKWTKNGTALARIVSSLLRFGSGLSLGPDADGLLNLGDVPAREWREVAEPPPAQRRAMFDVARLLDSGAWWGVGGSGLVGRGNGGRNCAELQYRHGMPAGQ